MGRTETSLPSCHLWNLKEKNQNNFNLNNFTIVNGHKLIIKQHYHNHVQWLASFKTKVSKSEIIHLRTQLEKPGERT